MELPACWEVLAVDWSSLGRWGRSLDMENLWYLGRSWRWSRCCMLQPQFRPRWDAFFMAGMPEIIRVQ